ncbi:MAG TPA: hydroxyisourate hydrolase [Thermomicrobiales bacterium]|nr:hydroxyisourate hydrolase [Thermomicrobiales bacterium]
MGRLTTHVLDTAQGRPAAGVHLELRRTLGEDRTVVGQFVTNADGRVDGPLVEGGIAGTWEIAFEVAEYFHGQPVPTADPPFLDIITLRFTIADPEAHYHVPLLVSPWSYSTYRGS